jgi:hypothetical protein
MNQFENEMLGLMRVHTEQSQQAQADKEAGIEAKPNTDFRVLASVLAAILNLLPK